MKPFKAMNRVVEAARHAKQEVPEDEIIRQRPVTPKEQRKNCLNCEGMQDFIKGLQGEIKRLQDLTNDLQMQLILAGVNP